MITLGAAAKLIVKDHKKLDNPVIHRVPSMMMVEHFRLEMEHDLAHRKRTP